ncbi:MAG TPA: hypothetical protein VHW96_06055 [Solirubrobacteraceae bacterium]|jgi:hypothetical protein|nr:hypothetical protein [Solirubrobacteraceae bacterium]
MADNPALILQIPAGGALDEQLTADRPASLAAGDVVVQRGPTDEEGVLEPPVAGQVVLSVPSPEALRRQAGELHQIIDEAGTSTEPIVVVVEAAEALRDDELSAVVAAAQRAARPVILRVIRNG